MYHPLISFFYGFIFFCTSLFSCDGQNLGDITIFSGTSSSGKSRIAKELIALEPNRKEDDLDLRLSPHIPRSNDMQKTMIGEVIGRGLNGQKMLVHMDQAGAFLRELAKQSVKPPIKSVLVYCRFHELSHRITMRNQSLNKEDWRDPLVPFDQYSNLYSVLQGKGQGLETLTLNEVCATYNDQFDAMIAYARKMGNPLPSDEQIKMDKIQSLQEFLKKMAIKESDENIVIVPKYPNDYTLVVDNSPMDGTQLLAERIHIHIAT